jgi:hypothetical protein
MRAAAPAPERTPLVPADDQRLDSSPSPGAASTPSSRDHRLPPEKLRHAGNMPQVLYSCNPRTGFNSVDGKRRNSLSNQQGSKFAAPDQRVGNKFQEIREKVPEFRKIPTEARMNGARGLLGEQ